MSTTADERERIADELDEVLSDIEFQAEMVKEALDAARRHLRRYRQLARRLAEMTDDEEGEQTDD